MAGICALYKYTLFTLLYFTLLYFTFNRRLVGVLPINRNSNSQIDPKHPKLERPAEDGRRPKTTPLKEGIEMDIKEPIEMDIQES